jgi:penicillin-binding protein 2
MVQGLLEVTSSGEGTAAEAFSGFDHGGFPVAGKTGTAQVAGADNALFAAFGPVRPGQTPEYAMVVVMEAVEAFGGTVAAPVARGFFDGVLDPALVPLLPATYATPIPSTGAGVPVDDEETAP